MSTLGNADEIRAAVRAAVAAQPVVDMHTHLYGPRFGTPVPNSCSDVDPRGLMLWGVDEMLTYHYLVAEFFRVAPQTVTPERFFRMPKPRQAEVIWEHLFVQRSPISEACRGVLTTLQRLGLDTADRHLDPYRTYFSELDPDRHVDDTMRLANVESITMTNNVFDDNEHGRWLSDPTLGHDERFKAVLRFDPLLLDWPAAAKKLATWGYHVTESLGEKTLGEVRRFLREWLDRTNSIYAAVSLPPDFGFPLEGFGGGKYGAGSEVLARAVLPVLAERGMPLAMMIGVRRGVNPLLREAGDMGDLADVKMITNLCARFPANRFFVTMLSRENQHDLAVAARKFANLMVFGCWWFLNIPSQIDAITRLRLELLGTSFIPQHSDARVLGQLIYKWDHSRRIIAGALADKYVDLAATGWEVTEAEIKRDVKLLLRDNFLNFLE
jgi:hypothetical protein